MNQETARLDDQPACTPVIGHADIMSGSIINNKSLIAFASDVSRDHTIHESLRERARKALLEDMIPLAHQNELSESSLHSAVYGENQNISQQAFEKLQSHTQKIDLKVTEANGRALSVLLQMATKEDLKKLKASFVNYLLLSATTTILSLAYFLTHVD
jgi:hypothetical protein